MNDDVHLLNRKVLFQLREFVGVTKGVNFVSFCLFCLFAVGGMLRSMEQLAGDKSRLHTLRGGGGPTVHCRLDNTASVAKFSRRWSLGFT